MPMLLHLAVREFVLFGFWIHYSLWVVFVTPLVTGQVCVRLIKDNFLLSIMIASITDYAQEEGSTQDMQNTIKPSVRLTTMPTPQLEQVEEELSLVSTFKPRLYQQTIFAKASMKNTLVVLPTGMGKTAIALMLSLHRLKNFKNSKVLFLAPTKPLVEQHKTTFESLCTLPKDKSVVFTGHIKPEKRQELWKNALVIFSTPQGLENDLLAGRINLQEVCLLVFDESHRATGDYAYNFIAEQYHKQAKYPRILGLTASPGSDLEKIMGVCENLFIEDIEIRTDTDPDVKQYVQEVNTNWVHVELNEGMKKLVFFLKQCYHSKIKEISQYGHLNQRFLQSTSKTDLLRIQASLHGEIARGNKEFEILKSISLAAEAMKVQHALELAETQSVTAVQSYMEKMQNQAVTSKVKAVQNLVRDVNFKSACLQAKLLQEKGVEHPKLEKLKGIIQKKVQQSSDVKLIIFNQYRDTASFLVDELNNLPGVKAMLFVGQAKKNGKGLSQKKQKEILDQFREGNINCLVSTSVGEEGLDVPSVDAVLFYEPVPSAIRHIQRRGRTGRLEKGEVMVFITKDTRDEAYRWSAHHKEKRMFKNLEDLKRKYHLVSRTKQSAFAHYVEQKHVILMDDRERSPKMAKELAEQGMKVQLKRLGVGDYMLSPECVVEFKNVKDFVDSILDGRLLEQVKVLKNTYKKPLLVVEGQEDIYSQRNIHPNAIRGMLATITVSYGIPLIQTKTQKETAGLLAMIAKREQEKDDNFTLHSRKPLTLKEQQEYLVASIPGVGSILSKPLLKKFGSVARLVNAKEEELRQVDKIGEKKAKEIQRVLWERYD
jgi:ERCC4-related helicase/DNA uptake protein ComE-like DNA-binding protein